MYLIKYHNFILLSLIVMVLAGCAENKRKPLQIIKSNRQSGSLSNNKQFYPDNTVIDTIYLTDSNNVKEKVVITIKLKNSLVNLMEKALAFDKSDKMSRIMQIENYEIAEKALLEELDNIARECGFEDFRKANRMIDVIKDYPEISSLLKMLEELETTKYKNQIQ